MIHRPDQRPDQDQGVIHEGTFARPRNRTRTRRLVRLVVILAPGVAVADEVDVPQPVEFIEYLDI